MDKNKEIEQELNELAPKLGGLERKNPFKTPDYYFQSLPEKVLERVKQNPTWTNRLEQFLNIFFTQIFRPRVAIPFAVCLVMVAVGIGFLKNGNQSSLDFTRQLSQVSTDEISDYLVDNFDDDDIDVITVSAKEDFRITKDILSEELDNYFNNNIDNQTLEEDLL